MLTSRLMNEAILEPRQYKRVLDALNASVTGNRKANGIQNATVPAALSGSSSASLPSVIDPLSKEVDDDSTEAVKVRIEEFDELVKFFYNFRNGLDVKTLFKKVDEHDRASLSVLVCPIFSFFVFLFSCSICARATCAHTGSILVPRRRI